MSGALTSIRAGGARLAPWFVAALGLTIPVSVAADHILMVLFLAAWLVAWRVDRVAAVVREVPVVTAACVLFGLLLLGGLWGAGDARDFAHYIGKYKELAFIALWLPWFADPKWRDRAIGALLAILGVTLLGSWASGLGFWEHLGPDRGPHNPTVFKNQITHNYLMAFGAFLFLMKAIEPGAAWRRGLFAVAALLSAVNVLAMVRGRTGYVVLVVLALYLVFSRLRWRARIVLVFAMVAGLATLYETAPFFRERIELGIDEARAWQPGAGSVTSIGIRLDYYSTSLAIIRDHPLVGVGTGGFERAYTAQVQGSGVPPSNNPHNQYLLLTAQLGLPGLAAFIGLLVVAWRAARRLPTAFETDAARGLVLALASGSVFNSLLLDHTEGMLFSWLVAVLYGGYRRSEPAAVGAAREVDAVERR